MVQLSSPVTAAGPSRIRTGFPFMFFHEPCFIRSMQRWARQNRAGLALTDDLPVDLLHAAIEDSANNTEASMALMTQPYDGPLQ